MYSSILVKHIVSDDGRLEVDFDDYLTIEIPTECPHCGKSMQPNHLVSFNTTFSSNKSIASIYLCSSCCKFIFVLNNNSGQTYISKIYPLSVENKKINQSIEELSPKFSKIYNQALTAEENGLDEICGIGYRKALEFLIKDFAIKRHPDDEETIKKAPLSACIKNYCDNEKIKTLSTACAWIGNDETHYVRKHEEYSVKTLKAFIKAVLTYIESELSLDEATELINS